LASTSLPNLMRQLVLSGDESFVLSARIALDAQGIRHSDERRGFLAGFENCILVDDADFERAVALVGGLRETRPSDEMRSDRAFRLFVTTAVVLMLVAVVAIVLAERG
jgi:hypothetical protein